MNTTYYLTAAAIICMNVATANEKPEEATAKATGKPRILISAEFKNEPFFFKGSGSCEGIEFADLNQDGLRDIISGVPGGKIHVYYARKGENGISYGEKQVLKNQATANDIFINHW